MERTSHQSNVAVTGPQAPSSKSIAKFGRLNRTVKSRYKAWSKQRSRLHSPHPGSLDKPRILSVHRYHRSNAVDYYASYGSLLEASLSSKQQAGPLPINKRWVEPQPGSPDALILSAHYYFVVTTTSSPQA